MINIVNNIFSASKYDFEDIALTVFKYQYENNLVYNSWVNALRVNPESVTQLTEIPFLPVSFFKEADIKTGEYKPEVVFESSGTTGSVNSRHFVKDENIYKRSYVDGFKMFYGEPSEYCIIGLLPAYLERSGSSLVNMVEGLIKLSSHPKSGFYLYEFGRLAEVLSELEAAGQRTLLIGVTFALLDFAEQFPMQLKHTIVMETGGMKGRRKEMVRDELHSYLKLRLGVDAIHSEYGMTELLSQGYSFGNGIFNTVPWMKVLLRDEDDPLLVVKRGRGLINVVDLANIDSCAFIATDDIGRIFEDGSFEVLGRRDFSDVRGCSLMVL